MERLQRVLASCGVASRRKSEQLIQEGRISVDGKVVQELGTRVDPERQEIRVDGQLVKWEPRRYIMLNKPTGYITTAADERGRRTVLDLVNVRERVVPVGRLDRQSSGLLLLTNDGELLFRVTHPKFELEKEYEVLVDGHPPPEVLDRLRRGVTVDGERVVPQQVRPMQNDEDGTVLRITIHEGRNRIVRRMLERVGYPVLKLERIRIGPLHVRGLTKGAWRDMTAGELQQLRDALSVRDEDVAGRPVGERGSRQRPPARRPAPTGRPGGGRPGDRRGAEDRPRREGDERPRRGPRDGSERSRDFGRKRGDQSSGGRPPGHRGGRPGGGGQEHRGQRGRPPS